MNERESSRVEGKLKSALHEASINAIGRSTGFTERMRVMTPYRVALTIIGALATQTVETIADLERKFASMTGCSISYKPFHNQLSKPEFADFMLKVLCHLLGELVVQVLEPVPGSPLELFDDIELQDGSSFAIADVLATQFPGRFTKTSPAAIELHATMSVLQDRIVRVALAPDTQGERDFLPDPNSLLRKLILADRGYEDRGYFARVDAAGGHFVIRCKGSVNPLVERCTLASGAVRQFANRRLKEFRNKLHGENADLVVTIKRGEGLFCYRLCLIWNPMHGSHMVLATNLAVDRFDVAAVREIYALRWQVELAFKEWKSYANLRKFQTGKAPIVQGLVWGALAAALLKRFLAHAAQVVHGVATSTRKVAMAVLDHLRDLLLVFLSRIDVGPTFAKLLDFLAHNARRAHPKRDASTGRLFPGLQAVMQHREFAAGESDGLKD